MFGGGWLMGMGKRCLYFPLPTMLITQQTRRQISDPLPLSPRICYLVRSTGCTLSLYIPVREHISGGSKGAPGMCPPSQSKFKILQNNRLAHHLGNPLCAIVHGGTLSLYIPVREPRVVPSHCTYPWGHTGWYPLTVHTCKGARVVPSHCTWWYPVTVHTSLSLHIPVRERRVVPSTAIVIGFLRPALSLYAPRRITETADGPMFISNSKMFQKATCNENHQAAVRSRVNKRFTTFNRWKNISLKWNM